MDDFVAFSYIALGVLVAVLYPVLWGWYKDAFPRPGGTKIPPQVKKYIGLLIFCLVTAFIVLVFYRSSHPDARLGFYTSVLLGFGWESSVEKVFNPPKRPPSGGNQGGASA